MATSTSKTKKIALAVLALIGVLAAAAVSYFDDDPTTNPNFSKVYNAVTETIGVINSEEVAPATTEDANSDK